MRTLKTFLIAVAALFMSVAANAQCSLTVENLSGAQGSTIPLSIGMNNGNTRVTSFQCDIVLPEGVTVKTETSYDDLGKELIDYVALLSSRKADHVLVVEKQAEDDGVYRYLSYSNTNRLYSGAEGEIFTTDIVLDAPVGEYEIKIKNVIATEVDTSGESLNKLNWEECSATLTITEAEEPIEIEDFQFYAKKITVDDKTKTATLDICLNNSDVVRDFSFGLILPEGVSVKREYDSYWGEYYDDIQKGTRLIGTYTKDTEENKIIFSYKASRETTIPAGDDVLLSINLDINITPSMCNIQLSNQSITKMTNSVVVSPSDFTSVLKVNGTETTTLTITDDKWATLCLPFDYTMIGDMKAYKATGIENGSIVLEPVTNTIPARTPVLVYGSPVTGVNLSGNNSGATKVKYTCGLLTGYLAVGQATTGYVLQKQNDNFGFYKINSSKAITIPPYRCVLNVPDPQTPAAQAPVFIRLGDAETGIDGINLDETHDNAIYTLDGKRVESMTKGNTYIINGRKVIIK